MNKVQPLTLNCFSLERSTNGSAATEKVRQKAPKVT